MTRLRTRLATRTALLLGSYLLAGATACGNVAVRNPEVTKSTATQSRAPDFTLQDEAGQSVELSQLVAKSPVIVVFYRGHWCPFCRKQLRDLARVHDQLVARDIRLVAISVDDLADSAALREKLDLPFSLLSDPGHPTIDAYGVLEAEHEIAVASVFIISQDQTILYRKIGENIRDRLYADGLLVELDRLKFLPKAK